MLRDVIKRPCKGNCMGAGIISVVFVNIYNDVDYNLYFDYAILTYMPSWRAIGYFNLTITALSSSTVRFRSEYVMIYV